MVDTGTIAPTGLPFVRKGGLCMEYIMCEGSALPERLEYHSTYAKGPFLVQFSGDGSSFCVRGSLSVAGKLKITLTRPTLVPVGQCEPYCLVIVGT